MGPISRHAHLDQVHVRVRGQVRGIEHRLAIRREAGMVVGVLVVALPARREPVNVLRWKARILGPTYRSPSHLNSWMNGRATLSLVKTKAGVPSPAISVSSSE